MRIALLVALAAGCSAPQYGDGHLQCAPSGACPSGFYCAGDQHCWRNGSGPPAASDDLSSAMPSDLADVVLDFAGADLAPSPSKCATSNALLCESFESLLLLSGWNQSSHNAIVSVDSTRAFRGKSSLRSSIQASAVNTSPYATVSETKSFPAVGALYVRVWAYFPSPLPAPFEQFLNFTDSGTGGLSIGTDTGAMILNDYSGGVFQASTTKMPLDRWVCVQFDMSQGALTGFIHMTVDGQLLADLPQTGSTPTAVNMILGVDFNANSGPVPAYDAWFDEIIVDNKPIACSD
ncbi:MAG: hypothetical protein JWM53_3435 [bacterium]|nr:hypothetical protein [bacterium]